MTRQTSVNLGSYFDAFIARLIESGRYDSPSEVVVAALHLLENHEGKRNLLRRLLEEGESSERVNYSYQAFIAELDASGS